MVVFSVTSLTLVDNVVFNWSLKSGLGGADVAADGRVVLARPELRRCFRQVMDGALSALDVVQFISSNASLRVTLDVLNAASSVLSRP